jgi:hypothetical protein
MDIKVNDGICHNLLTMKLLRQVDSVSPIRFNVIVGMFDILVARQRRIVQLEALTLIRLMVVPSTISLMWVGSDYLVLQA